MNLNFRIEHYGSVDSTNDIVRERHEAGEPPGLIVRADEQTIGRGRSGRRWESPKGNLYTSILLKPDVPGPQLPSLSLVIAVCLAEAIGPKARLKWPNDVLIEGSKTAGILLETVDDCIIAGIGVNVASHPPQSLYPTTHLRAEGLEATPSELLNALLSRLRIYIPLWQRHGFTAILPHWLERGPKPGEWIRVRDSGQLLDAQFVGLSPTGGLEVRNDDKIVSYNSAEIIISAI